MLTAYCFTCSLVSPYVLAIVCNFPANPAAATLFIPKLLFNDALDFSNFNDGETKFLYAVFNACTPACAFSNPVLIISALLSPATEVVSLAIAATVSIAAPPHLQDLQVLILRHDVVVVLTEQLVDMCLGFSFNININVISFCGLCVALQLSLRFLRLRLLFE